METQETVLSEIECFQRVYQSPRLSERLTGSEEHHSDLTMLQLHSGCHRGPLHQDHAVRHLGLEGPLLECCLGVGVILDGEIAGPVVTQHS